jgi:peptidoglycan-associated lipoprotein|tara:strand:- start:17398 stop:17892 length:495 start_codon:yes stop_codon:yes gene_type:complete
MKITAYKYSAIALISSVLLAGCSSVATAPSDNISPSDNITTGSVDDSSIRGSSIGTDSRVARVFYFEFDKVMLNAEARSALRLHAKNLQSSQVSVRLLGHADERGSREYNMALGESRGNAVRDFLIQEGVNESLIEVVSYGEEQAAVSGSEEGSWALNRRVELK